MELVLDKFNNNFLDKKSSSTVQEYSLFQNYNKPLDVLLECEAKQEHTGKTFCRFLCQLFKIRRSIRNSRN